MASHRPFLHCPHTAKRSVLQAYCNKICDKVDFPMQLATQLYSSRHIDTYTLEKIQTDTHLPKFERNISIVLAVEKRSEDSSEDVFDRFIEILEVELEFGDNHKLIQSMKGYKKPEKPYAPCDNSPGPKEDLSIVTDLLQGQSDLIGEPVDLLCDLYSAGIVNRRMLENLLQNSEEEHLKKLIIAKQRVFLKAHNRYLNYVLQVLEENDNNYLDSVVSDIRKEMNIVASDCQEGLAGPASLSAIEPAESTAMSGIIHSSNNLDATGPESQPNLLESLGSLVQSVKNIIISANIELQAMKDCLLQHFPFDSDDRRDILAATSLNEIFDIIQRVCTVTNYHILNVIGKYFRNAQILLAVIEYELKTDISRITLLSEVLQSALTLENRSKASADTDQEIEMKVNWPQENQRTVEDFREVTEKGFQFLSDYIHLSSVQRGCLLLRCYTFKCLVGAFRRMAEERENPLKKSGVIYLKIGGTVMISSEQNQIILNGDQGVQTALSIDNQDYLMERIQSLQDLLAMEQELSQKVYLELEAEQGSHQQRKRELEAERTAHQETMLEFEAEKRMSLNMKFQVDKLMEEKRQLTSKLKEQKERNGELEALLQQRKNELQDEQTGHKETKLALEAKEEAYDILESDLNKLNEERKKYKAELEEQENKYKVLLTEKDMQEKMKLELMAESEKFHTEKSDFVQLNKLLENLRAENLNLKMNKTKVIRPGVFGLDYSTVTERRHTLSVRINNQITAENIDMVPSPLGEKRWITTIGKLDRPFHIDISKENIVVSEYYGQCVSVFSKDGVFIRSFGKKGVEEGEFHCPSGVAITEDNHVLVVDKNNNRVQKFTMSGEFVKSVGSSGSGPLQFSALPVGLAIHRRTGKIYVCDSDNHRVQVLNPDLTFSHEFGTFGFGPEQFYRPYDIAFDKNDLIYVADRHNNRVQILTLQGKYHGEFGKEFLESPEGIAIDVEKGIVYVSDCNKHTVSMFKTDTGKPLGVLGGYGEREKGLFNMPCGMAVDEDGSLYLCDRMNRQLQIF